MCFTSLNVLLPNEKFSGKCRELKERKKKYIYRFKKQTGRKGEEKGAVSELWFHGVYPHLLSIHLTQCTGPDAGVGLSYSHTGYALHNSWGATARDNRGGTAEEAGWLLSR